LGKRPPEADVNLDDNRIPRSVRNAIDLVYSLLLKEDYPAVAKLCVDGLNEQMLWRLFNVEYHGKVGPYEEVAFWKGVGVYEHDEARFGSDVSWSVDFPLWFVAEGDSDVSVSMHVGTKKLATLG
jgi:hypothetical protein